MALANEIAAKRAEYLTTMDPDDVPACSGPPTCRAEGVNVFADPLQPAGEFECTRWVDGADVPQPGGDAAAQGIRFRVDNVVTGHPDQLRQPRARLVVVSVCWLDGGGFVRELQTRRLMVPGA